MLVATRLYALGVLAPFGGGLRGGLAPAARRATGGRAALSEDSKAMYALGFNIGKQLADFKTCEPAEVRRRSLAAAAAAVVTQQLLPSRAFTTHLPPARMRSDR